MEDKEEAAVAEAEATSRAVAMAVVVRASIFERERARALLITLERNSSGQKGTSFAYFFCAYDLPASPHHAFSPTIILKKPLLLDLLLLTMPFRQQ